jgi:hypothetical protein
MKAATSSACPTFLRAHRLTNRRDVNLYVIICDQSADRVLEDNVNEKVCSSELAIDGRLLGEASEERGIAELLRDAMNDFRDHQDCPDEETLSKTWPALRDQLQAAAESWGRNGRKQNAAAPIDLASVVFPLLLAKPVQVSLAIPVRPQFLPPWRRIRFAAVLSEMPRQRFGELEVWKRIFDVDPLRVAGCSVRGVDGVAAPLAIRH